MSVAGRIGLLFVVLGIVIVGLSLDIMYRVGLTTAPIIVLAIGLFVAILGAVAIPNSGMVEAGKSTTIIVGPLLDRVPGLSRVGDPKPPTPPTTPVG